MNAALNNTLRTGGCVSIKTDTITHDEYDAYGKMNGLTITYAEWHPHPEYRIFKTGTLLSRNDKYPSGLIIIDNRGNPIPYKKD